MRLAPLTARTLEAYKKIGYMNPGVPQRVILIEHEGAIIAGAELVETQGARGVFIMSLCLAHWVQEELMLKASRAIFKAAANYANIVGQGVLFLGATNPSEAFPEGWALNGRMAVYDPFQVVPERPAAPSEPPPKATEDEPGEALGKHETEPPSEEGIEDDDVIGQARRESQQEAKVRQSPSAPRPVQVRGPKRVQRRAKPQQP